MRYKEYYYRILCEDKAHYHFARGWLLQKGVEERQIDLWGELPHPGCGADYVLKELPEVKKQVAGPFPVKNEILVVLLDVDNHCLAQLEASLDDQNFPMFLILPARSIDTWCRFLLDPEHEDALDESKSCKLAYKKGVKHGKLGAQLAGMDLAKVSPLPESLRLTYMRVRDKKGKLGL